MLICSLRCLTNPSLFVISGGPGSGKTTVFREVALAIVIFATYSVMHRSGTAEPEDMFRILSYAEARSQFNEITV